MATGLGETGSETIPVVGRGVDWRQLGALVLVMVPVVLLWNTVVVYPLKILVVFFHELSHGVAAILTGGRIVEIQVVKEQGGLCLTQGGSRFLTLTAGYLGSELWGGAALVHAARTRLDRLASTVLGAIILIATVLWVRPLLAFGFWFHLGAGAAILGLGLLLPEKANEWFLKIFGLTSCLYVVADIWSDTIARSGLVSDARMLAQMTHVPTVIWGGVWLVLAVVIALAGLRVACRRQTASPANR